MTRKTAHGFDNFDLFLFWRGFLVMRQQFRQLPEWMGIDSGEYVFQIFVWIDATGFAGGDEVYKDGISFAEYELLLFCSNAGLYELEVYFTLCFLY